MKKRSRAATPPPHRPSRRHIFMLFTAAFPFLVVALLEVGLRLGGYGPDLSLFTTESIAGRPSLIMNPDAKARYFAKVDFTPNTSHDAFPAQKETGVFRIFCLGGSTTAGFPYGYSGSFSSFLRDRLKALFPDRRVEVINLGMTATNSFTVLDMARELRRHEPDLLIVYDGHNEFYGALGGASRESVGRSRWITLLYLRLVHSRVFLLARDLYTRLLPADAAAPGEVPSGTMMERLAYGQQIPYGSDVYNDCLETFRANLADLVSTCSAEGIPLMLSTQVSNLRHRAPFASGPAAGESDSTTAGAWYARALAADRAGRSADARAGFIRARDLDQLRFRASSDFNDAIRDLEGRDGVMVVDIERSFAAASPDSIVGSELILEHLHPNATGYFLMAGAYASAMRRRGLLASGEEWARRDTLPDAALLASSPLTPVDERAARRRTELLTSGWPFTNRRQTPDAGTDPIARIVEELVGGRITWEQAHVSAARHFEATGDTAAMAREYRALINQLPQNVSAYLILAQACLRWDRPDEAEGLLTRSLEVEPTFFAHRTLGGLALRRNRPDQAIPHLRRAVALHTNPQERSETGYLLAVAFQRAGKPADARTALLDVLAASPAFAPARSLLERLERGAQ